MNPTPYILMVGDAPCVPTGFGKVTNQIGQRFASFGARVDVWGINFNGHGYRKAPWATIHPAGEPWTAYEHMESLLRQLGGAGYTHVWIMQDSFMLRLYDFPKTLREVCEHRKIKSMYYFPVDSSWEPEWSAMIEAVDYPVAYTKYGRGVALAALKAHRAKKENDEALKLALANSEQAPLDLNLQPSTFNLQPLPQVDVLPHGIEDVFEPLPAGERARLRLTFWDVPAGQQPWLKPDDFVLVNVNQNQVRKDIPRSMELLAALRKLGVPARMIFHMHETSPHSGISINTIGRQLGMTFGVEYIVHDAFFKKGQGRFKDTQLRDLYNLSDACLTTSLGEGWGLSITEALGCGCPVFLPDHTSCGEIARELLMYCGMDRRFVLLPIGDHCVQVNDNSRLRPRVDLDRGAQAIAEYWRSGEYRRRPAMDGNARQWLNWDRVARMMWHKLVGTQPWMNLPESSAVPSRQPVENAREAGGLSGSAPQGA